MHTYTIRQAVLASVVPMLAACSMGLTDVPDPSTIVSPEIVQTQAGAIGLYNQALSRFNRTYAGTYNAGITGASFALATGLGSDEFAGSRSPGFALRRMGIGGDLPVIPNAAVSPDQPYGDMHATRLLIDQSIGALKTYASSAPSSYVAQMYALRGYLSIMFAELYCSGVPFSRAIYGGDVVFGHPKTTVEILDQAIADFDSALALTADSVRVRRMAYIGKARALVNQGEFARAAALMSVDSIPTTFRYDMRFNTTGFPNFVAGGKSTDIFASLDLSVANRLGTNGLNYYEAGAPGVNKDSRVGWYTSGGFSPVPYPAKYADGSAPIPLADGIEARLIEAEARFNANDYTGWANILNTLRQSGGTTVIPALPADSTTSASQTLREDVMFRERAFWLYATGHRFGDMRRMIRQYHRATVSIFPIGTHPSLPTPDNVFSEHPNFAPPQLEADTNPYFTGCFNRDA